MKLTTTLLLAVSLHVCAKGISQRVTLSVKNVSLKSVFIEINKQTGFNFLFSDEALAAARPVSVNVKDAPLVDVLNICFKDQPLSYVVENNAIVVRQDPAGVRDNAARQTTAPPVDISGRVMNELGEPLANASVFVRRTGKGVQTDVKGYFKLRNLNEDDILVVSYIGYETVSMPVKGRTDLFLVMKIATNELDKTVIMAYGTTSKRLTTANIGKVSSEEIEKQPVVNPLLALQGRVAGLVVTPTSGYASGVVKVEIRGRNTINPSFVSDPLYIIDGVPMTAMELSGNSSYKTGSTGIIQNGMLSPAGGQSPFFGINPADIESIEVLKDADATAIYGSRGANGVLLITTKKGKAGKTRLNMNVTQGVSAVTRKWDMLNMSQYLEMRREAFRNDGIVPTAMDAPDMLVWDTTKATDWQDVLWGRNGKMTEASLTVSGGDARTVFRLNGTYRRQTEILSYSGANQRASAAFSFQHSSPNQAFRTSFSANFSYTDVNTINFPGSSILSPNAPPIFNAKGELNFDDWNAAGLPFSYPFAMLRQPYTSKTNFLSSNLLLEYDLVKGLKASVSAGYNNTQGDQEASYPMASFNPLVFPFGMAMFGSTAIHNWIIEPQLNYTTTIGRGRLVVLAGATKQSNVTGGLSSLGIGYTNDAFIHSIANAPIQQTAETKGQYKFASVFGRVNYNWQNKYLLNFNMRRDGSSRFGPGKQYGNFGSVGAAWIATEESWLKGALPNVLNFLKVRGSYGLTGSDAVGEYQYLSQWANGVNNNPAFSYNGVTPLISQHAVNQDYHWQVNKKLEFALDLGLLRDNKIYLELAYYQNRCDDQLTQFPTPMFTGFANVTANWPATVQNSGIEITGNADIITGKKFSWSVVFNAGINRNRLVDYPGIESSPYAATYKIGKSLNTIYLLHYTGVDPLTGRYSFADYNKDGVAVPIYSNVPGTGNDDRYIALDLSPQYTGGVGTNLSYKNLRCSMFFDFKKQIGQKPNAGYQPGAMANQPLDVFNGRWQKPGDQAEYEKFTTQGTISYGYLTQSDGVYTDASYLRLSTLALSYTLPASFTKKAGMESCSIYMNAQNVFMITNYKGVDPDIQAFGIMPASKIYTTGIIFNF